METETKAQDLQQLLTKKADEDLGRRVQEFKRRLEAAARESGVTLPDWPELTLRVSNSDGRIQDVTYKVCICDLFFKMAQAASVATRPGIREATTKAFCDRVYQLEADVDALLQEVRQ